MFSITIRYRPHCINFGRVFLALVMVLTSVLAAFRPVAAGSTAWPEDPRPANPLERYNLPGNDRYDPGTAVFNPLSANTGQWSTQAGSPTSKTSPSYWNSPNLINPSAPATASLWHSLKNWWSGLTTNTAPPLQTSQTTTKNTNNILFDLKDYQPAEQKNTTADEPVTTHTIENSSSTLLTSNPNNDSSSEALSSTHLSPLDCPIPPGQGAPPEIAGRILDAWLPSYGCPVAGPFIVAEAAGTDYIGQKFPDVNGAIVDNPNDTPPTAYFLPEDIWTAYVAAGIPNDEHGGPLGSFAGAPYHFIDENGNNFRGSVFWQFEYGFVAYNVANDAFEAHHYYPIFPQIFVSWEEDDSSTAAQAYTFSGQAQVNSAPPYNGQDEPYISAPGLSSSEITLVIEDEEGNIEEISPGNMSAGSVLLSGTDTYFVTETLKIYLKADRLSDGLVGYGPCTHYDPDPNAQVFYYVVPTAEYEFPYDCESSGGPADTTPPTIEILQVYGTGIQGNNLLSASMLVRITDDTAVANSEVTVSVGDVTQQLAPYSDSAFGEGVYAATFQNIPDKTLVTFTITASDPAGNVGLATADAYFVDGQLNGFSACYDPCSMLGYTAKYGNPVSTVTGDKTEQFPLLYVAGPGAADIIIVPTYNSSSVRLGIFGAAMSSELETQVVELYNPLVPGVEVVIGDGGRFRFLDNGDGTFTAVSQGNEDTLIKDGDGYLYTTRSQISYRFDGDGRLIEKLDRNDNAVTYAYSGSQLTTISTSGRTVNLTYNSDDYVQTLQIEDKVITLTYEGSKLVGINDAEGGSWTLEYETRDIGEIIDERGQEFAYFAQNHYLTKVTTPEGRVKNEQSYDAEGRVEQQTSSAEGELTFTYIENGDGSKETRITDTHGETEIHYYNALGQLVQKTDRTERSEFYEYDDDFHMIRKVDFNGYEWNYVRDDNGNIIDTTGPEGFHESWEYNAINFPTFHRDGDGFEWAWEYDADGNLTRINQPDGTYNTMMYDSRGLLTDIYDFNNNHIHNVYDAVTGDLLSTTDGEGSTTGYTYDGYGRRVTMTLPKGNLWQYSYDLNDNLTAVDGPIGYHTEFEYDKDSLLIREQDADGNDTHYTYDERGRLIRVKDAATQVTTFSYGPMNEMVEMVNPRRAVYSYSHDDNYRVVQIDMPLGVTLQFTYDGLDNVLYAIDGLGRVTATTYDGLSRPLAVVQNHIQNGPINADTNVVTQFEHDYRGNVTKVISPIGDEQEFSFNAVNQQEWVENEEDERTLYTYDPNGNLIRVTFPEGNTIETEYNGRNQPELLRDGEGYETIMAYDLNGNLENVIDPDGITQHYDYNELDQVVVNTANHVLSGGSGHDLNVTTTFVNSHAGDLLKVIDGENFEFEYEYDRVHRLVHETNPEGELFYSYDKSGNLVRMIDANGQVWKYQYDLLERLTMTINPENHRVRYQYDRADNLLRMRDANGNITVTTYDGLNRPTKVKDALNYLTVFEYDAVGNLLFLTDGNNHTAGYEYDRAQRLLARIDAEGFRVEYEYDDNGRQAIQRIPFADPGRTIVEQMAYDGRDLLVAYTNGEGEVTEYGYSSVGLLESQTENDNVITFYEYDGLRRLNQVTLNYVPGGQPVGDVNVAYHYRYDRVGNLDSVIDPLGHETTFDYNGLGSLEYEQNPVGSVWVYDYDPAQNLTFRRDANGEETTYSYFPDNQLQLIDYPGDPDVSYQYDPNNNLTQMADGLGITTRSYDKLDRVTEVNDSLNREVHYSYDAVNRRSITYPDGRSVSYTYFDNDWLETATDPVGGTSAYSYDDAGRVVYTDHPNNTHSSRTYDRANRLLFLGNYQETQNGQDVLSEFSYLYDAVGQRTQVTSVYGWRQPDTVVENYTYDNLRRLTGVTDSEGLETVYGYDRASNRTLWETNDDPYGQSPQDGFTAVYTYDAANRLLTADITRTPASQSEFITYEYDANGNRINRLVDGRGIDEGTAFTYDDENRLVSAYDYLKSRNNVIWQDETTMAYDGNGRRLIETYDPLAANGGGLKQTEYTFDGRDPIAEYDLWNNHQRNYYRGRGNELIQMHNFPFGSQGQQYWYHHNGLNAVAGLTKHDGQSTHNYRYDAYGGVIPANGNWTQPHNEYTLTEKAYDNHTDLFYFGARHYDAQTANWLTQDTYRGLLLKPWTIHRFGYVRGNPTNYNDPDGRFLNLATAAVGGLVGGVVGGVTGAVADYGGQVVSNLAEGKSLRESLTDVDTNSIIASGAGGIVQGAACGAVAGATFGVGLAVCGTLGGGLSSATSTLTSNVLNGKDALDGVGSSFLEGSITGTLSLGLSKYIPKGNKLIEFGGEYIIESGVGLGSLYIHNEIDSDPCTNGFYGWEKALRDSTTSFLVGKTSEASANYTFSKLNTNVQNKGSYWDSNVQRWRNHETGQFTTEPLLPTYWDPNASQWRDSNSGEFTTAPFGY